MKNFPEKARLVMNERFGHDSLISLATAENNIPSVRTVNALYQDGCFYVITYALSNKMQQIAKNPQVAVSGDWFTGRGVGENLGYVLAPENAALAAKLQKAFASWLDNGHTNLQDPNTCILCIRLESGVLFANGQRFDIRFV